MNDFVERVRSYCDQFHMLQKGDRVAVGVSGGADSVALLLVLCALQEEYELSLHVVHVHHGIRKEAGKDAAFVENLCKAREIPFTLVEKNVPKLAKLWKISEEEAGRRVRYEALEQLPADKIAVAHHQGDQAETVLHNLFRGTGLAGLGGMRPVNGRVIRPLLCVDRPRIEVFLGEQGVSFVTDQTNLTDDYTRNRIRHHILEYTTQNINGQAVSHVAQAAEVVQETREFLKRQTEQALQACMVQTGEVREGERKGGAFCLEVSRFRVMDPFLQKQLLLEILHRLTNDRKELSSTHIGQIAALFDPRMDGAGEKLLYLPHGLRAVRRYEQVILYRDQEEWPEQTGGVTQVSEIPVKLPRELRLPDGRILKMQLLDTASQVLEDGLFWERIPKKTCTKWFDYDKIKHPVQLRTRQTGDYLIINSIGGRKSLQDYMVNEKIPKSARDQTLLLTDGNCVIWVIGHRISENYKVTRYTKRILAVDLIGGN